MFSLYNGGIVSIFSQKFFQNFFHEYTIERIEPPYGLSKCHIWGGYGGGRGSYWAIAPHATM